MLKKIRVYDQLGSGMEWHVDDILFTRPQIEIVLTIENSSDCETMWEESISGMKSSSDDENMRDLKKIKAVQTEPNSVILIQAGGARHRVSALKNNGQRLILKFVYVHDDEDNVMLQSADQQLHQFSNKRKNRTAASTKSVKANRNEKRRKR